MPPRQYSSSSPHRVVVVVFVDMLNVQLAAAAWALSSQVIKMKWCDIKDQNSKSELGLLDGIWVNYFLYVLKLLSTIRGTNNSNSSIMYTNLL